MLHGILGSMSPFLLIDRRTLFALLAGLAVVTLSFLVAFGWVQSVVLREHDADRFEALDQDLALRRQLDRNLGREALIQGLEWRLENFGAERVFVIVDSSGNPSVGSWGLVPEGRRVLDRPDLRLRLRRDNETYIYVSAIRLDDGAHLITSSVDEERLAVARLMGRAASGSVALLLLVSLLVAFGVNKYVVGHLRRIADTARSIMSGQMTARVPIESRLDALDALSLTFNEMLDQNEALVSGMRTATESLAHDLRTPLMRMGRSIRSARDTEDSVLRDAHLAEAERSARRTLDTFNALINLARAEAGLSRDSMEIIDLDVLIKDLIELFEPLAWERSQHLERSLEPLQIVGHRQILAQAIGNLLENAIKYSPPASTLQLRVVGGAVPEIIVEDRGPGIPAQVREQATRRFVRLENASSETTGIGLGLAIAAAVARLHRGRLVLESAEPGLRVRLQLNPT